MRRITHIPSFIKECFKWEYETCQKCGTAYRLLWHVKNEIWDKVTNTSNYSGGCYCVDCFIKKAEKQGIEINPEDISIRPFYP